MPHNSVRTRKLLSLGGTRCPPPLTPHPYWSSAREARAIYVSVYGAEVAMPLTPRKHSRNHFSFLEPSPRLLRLYLNTLCPVLLPSTSNYERLLRAFAVRSLLVLSSRTRGLCAFRIAHGNRRIDFLSGASRGRDSSTFSFLSTHWCPDRRLSNERDSQERIECKSKQRRQDVIVCTQLLINS